VTKYLGLDPDRPDNVVALATFTNDPRPAPDLTEIFRAPLAGALAEQRIWYIGFFAVNPTFRGNGLFRGRDRADVAAGAGQSWHRGPGTSCRRNNDLGLPKAIHQTLDELTTGVRTSQLDETGLLAVRAAHLGPDRHRVRPTGPDHRSTKDPRPYRPAQSRPWPNTTPIPSSTRRWVGVSTPSATTVSPQRNCSSRPRLGRSPRPPSYAQPGDERPVDLQLR